MNGAACLVGPESRIFTHIYIDLFVTYIFSGDVRESLLGASVFGVEEEEEEEETRFFVLHRFRHNDRLDCTSGDDFFFFFYRVRAECAG